MELVYPDSPSRSIKASSPDGKRPIGNLLPRRFSARVSSDEATVISIDRETLEKALAWSDMGANAEENGVQVMDLSGGSETTGEWMFSLLQSPIFKELPTPNIEKFFACIERIDVKEGETVITQGEQGDYYYMIATGEADVLKNVGIVEMPLASLKVGDAFGEEALLAGAPRNATVRMKTDGVLMRLAATDFQALLTSPMVRWLNPREAVRKVKEGAVLLDVRTEREHGVRNIRGSKNIPLYKLRQEADDLDQEKVYIAYCDTGARSSAGAFLLSEPGLHGVCHRRRPVGDEQELENNR